MKTKKLLLAIVLTVFMIVTFVNTSAYAVTSMTLGVEKVREGVNNVTGQRVTRYAYQANSKYVLKIVDRAAGFSKSIYCLKGGPGFGTSDGWGMGDRTYNTSYDMKLDRTNATNVLSLNSANYGSILWLLDNIYLPKQTSAAGRNQLLQAAFASEFANINSFFWDWTVDELHMTDDDIDAVQQCALWYFTNSDAYHMDSMSSLWVSTSGDRGTFTSLGDVGPLLTDWADPVNEGYVRLEEAKVLYNYLITTARANSNYTKVPTQLNINHSLVARVEQGTGLNANYMVIGPFEIQKSGNTNYTFSGQVTDKNGNPISYEICSANGTTNGMTLERAVGAGQFYIRVTKANLKNIDSVKLSMSYTTNETTANLWTVGGSNSDQPVVIVDRTPITNRDEITVKIPEFDLALRKYITAINERQITSRIPDVDTTPLKEKTGTTAIYTHPKTPLTVNVGDKVVYTIRVYNESESDGIVTSIEDYLPSQLEIVPKSESTINTKYNWTVTGRAITTDYLKGTVLRAYNGGDTLDSAYVEIECRVKNTAVSGEILTNIAQIAGANREDDRDSTPDNVRKPSDTNLPNYAEHQEDDDDYEKVIVYIPQFDLALRKFITGVNDKKVTDRVPDVDTTPLKEETDTTAIYTHPKDPVTVRIGDKVTYTIRVYNEAEIDGIVTSIEDYLPEELELVPASESTINAKYGWTGSGRTVKTDYLKGTTLKAYNGGDTLDYADVEIECRVKDIAEGGKILTNIAQIAGANRDNDRDSTPDNVRKPSDTNLPNYAEHQEDDDDYEKLVVYKPAYDLALRKFITGINDQEITNREPRVNVTPIKEGKTTAIYTHPKNALLVRNGDLVTYTIRVYNEGVIDGYAEEIKDNIPQGLEYVIDNETNIKYRWKLSSDEKSVSTDYLSSERGEDNKLAAFDPETGTELAYKDVQIVFKVTEPNTSTRILINTAEIKKDDGDDIDSTPDNDVPNEDDIDKEYVKLKYFDLALRKFITKVEDKNGENLPVETDTTTDVSREPKVEIDENGKITYVHPKDPVVVANSDIVIYTLRVYNEGRVDGFAEEIKDDVPNGLELVPEHEINVKYGWVMYDSEGEETEDVTKAKTIRTTYLSEENGADNIIKAFDRDTMTVPDYKDVQVAFRVVEKNIDNEDRIVINTAEISKDNDDDIDSTPDNNVPNEDDIDKEYIKVKFFDLSLLKWVSKAIVTEDGKTTVRETGYNGLENPEPLVKVEIKSKKLKSTVVKFEYGIRITNEGEIAGYATEVADYIPAGLEFVPEDNPLWTLKEDGKIVTRQLENTLLQPGESATITVVFKWINGNDNMGVKRNVAEISEDRNDKDAEDIDSTPDNKVPGEDDIDTAYVALSIKTGGMVVYIALPIIVCTIIAGGVILIKKYVL